MAIFVQFQGVQITKLLIMCITLHTDKYGLLLFYKKKYSTYETLADATRTIQ